MSEQTLPEISLTHGQALVTMWNALAWWRNGEREPEPWLGSYVKYLRRQGCPFAENELGCGAGGNVLYSFDHLMEVGVALLLRASGIAKKDVAEYLAEQRETLRPIYRQAHLERSSGLGKRAVVSTGGMLKYRNDGKHFVDNSQYLEYHNGVFVDLGVEYAGPRLAFTSEPKALGPTDVIKLLSRQRCYFGIIALSQLAEKIVGAAKNVPNIRRGRQ